MRRNYTVPGVQNGNTPFVLSVYDIKYIVKKTREIDVCGAIKLLSIGSNDYWI